MFRCYIRVPTYTTMNKTELKVAKISDIKKDTPQLPSNLLCFSHLRWDCVYQRPQHLLTRFSKIFKVYFLEEPICDVTDKPFLSISAINNNLYILTPHLYKGLSHSEIIEYQTDMLDTFLENKIVSDFVFWYYTPMALEFSARHNPSLIVYDCMDELSAFKFAPAQLKGYEKDLFSKAHIAFTGGYSLYEHKKNEHKNIFPFPSSIDKNHFGKARKIKPELEDQQNIPHPRIGFFGVIDERFDIELIREIAEQRPDWHIVLIGPIRKVDSALLPKSENIHYLGQKNYQELPLYLAGWDIALIPFLLNESTKFISPTKTPEYLAAGIPVVSTAIKDVVRPYGDMGMVHIAHNSKQFIHAIQTELISTKKEWLALVDEFLEHNSWDLTCSKMVQHMEKAIVGKKIIQLQ